MPNIIPATMSFFITTNIMVVHSIIKIHKYDAWLEWKYVYNWKYNWIYPILLHREQINFTAILAYHHLDDKHFIGKLHLWVYPLGAVEIIFHI